MLRDWSFRLTGVVSKKRSISMPASRLLLNLWLPGSARVRAFRFQGCHSTDAARESDQPDASGLSGATINQISHIRHSRRTNLSHPTRYTRASSSPHPANRSFLVNRTDQLSIFWHPKPDPHSAARTLLPDAIPTGQILSYSIKFLTQRPGIPNFTVSDKISCAQP